MKKPDVIHRIDVEAEMSYKAIPIRNDPPKQSSSSVAASIERELKRIGKKRGMACGEKCECELCDRHRLAAASRMMADLERYEAINWGKAASGSMAEYYDRREAVMKRNPGMSIEQARAIALGFEDEPKRTRQ